MRTPFTSADTWGPEVLPEQASALSLVRAEECIVDVASAQTAVDVGGAAGAAADLATRGAWDRTGRYQHHIARRHGVAYRYRCADIVDDRLPIQFVCAGRAFADND